MYGLSKLDAIAHLVGMAASALNESTMDDMGCSQTKHNVHFALSKGE
jgi:hypothetical protein